MADSPSGPAAETTAERDQGLHALISRYLADLIYGANDGIVTTLAIVSGVKGANLSAQVILVLGFANLIADGFSMGASNYLSKRSEAKPEDRLGHLEATQRGWATFLGFVVAGIAPLLGYLLPDFGMDRFVLAVILALFTLFVVGASRALFSEVNWFRAGMEMFLVGTLAGAVAYGIGMLGSSFVGGKALV